MQSGIRTLLVTTGTALFVACVAHPSADKSTVLRDPNDPANTIAVTPSTERLCGSICDALIESYGVPGNLRDACIFECATGFEKAPDACYELVSCVADHSLCSAGDISPGCMTRANDCLAQWSLANGSCRGCWQPSRTVHGKQIVTYLSEGTPPAQDRPEDFSGKTIAALLPRSSGIPYVFPGTGNADGTYVIRNVPGCGVWIQVGTTYTWATNADVDTSHPYQGRSNVVIAGPKTTYEIDLANMVPFDQRDWIEFFIPQLGSVNGGWWGITPPSDGSVPDGATTFHWSVGAKGYGLYDAAQNDVIYFSDLPTQTLADGSYLRTVKRAARVAGLTAQSGVPNPISVTFQDVPVTRTVHLDYRRSTFDVLAGDLNPKSVQGSGPGAPEAHTGTVDIWTHAGRPRYGATAELVLLENQTRGGDLAPVDVAFGTPYDASWGIDIAATSNWSVTLTDRNGAAFNPVEFIGVTQPLDRMGSAPIAARVGPARNIRINGRSAFEPQNGGTLTPTIEWDPPALGPVSHYRIGIHIMDTTGQFKRNAGIAELVIPGLDGASEPTLRSVTIPPGILQAGKDYFFHLEATYELDERSDTAHVVTAEYRP